MLEQQNLKFIQLHLERLFDFIQDLIDNDRTVMVGVPTENFDVSEEWASPKKGGVGHVFNIVGYGRGINPVTLKDEPYAIVIDSLHGRTWQKMPFEELRNNLTDLITTKDVEIMRDKD